MARALLPLILSAFALISANAAAQSPASQGLADRDAIHAQTAAFMARATDNQLEAAYQQLRPFLGVASEPFDQSASDASAYFQRVTTQVGQPLSGTHLRNEGIGEHFYRELWLQKFNAAAIAWTFTFYRPKDDWKLVGVSYSTDLESLYQPQ